MSKLLVMGYARHGKDTFCELLCQEYSLTFTSSSMAAAELLYPKLSKQFGYKTIEECFKDRINQRQRWFEEISALNTPDKTFLAQKIFAKSDIYCGLRSTEEFYAIRSKWPGIFIVWVDASKRLPEESVESCSVGPHLAAYIVDNNQVDPTLGHLRKQVRLFIDWMSVKNKSS